MIPDNIEIKLSYLKLLKLIEFLKNEGSGNIEIDDTRKILNSYLDKAIIKLNMEEQK